MGQLRGHLAAVEPQGVADAAVELIERPALTQRGLEGPQPLAHAIDQRPLTTEIERARDAAVAVAEAVVGTVLLGADPPPACGHAPLPGKKFRPGGNQVEGGGARGEGSGHFGGRRAEGRGLRIESHRRRSPVLVHKLLIFQFMPWSFELGSLSLAFFILQYLLCVLCVLCG